MTLAFLIVKSGKLSELYIMITSSIYLFSDNEIKILAYDFPFIISITPIKIASLLSAKIVLHKSSVRPFKNYFALFDNDLS